MEFASILIILAMLVLNSLFAAYELALASVSLGRLRLLAEQKRRGAAAALAMKGRMEASLAVVQIGITLVGGDRGRDGGGGREARLAEMTNRRRRRWRRLKEKFSEFSPLLRCGAPGQEERCG